MDKQARTTVDAPQRALIERTFQTLRALGVDAEIDKKAPKGDVDYAVTVGRGTKRAHYLAEAKHTLRPATVGPVLLRLRQLKQPTLLLTEYVTPQMATLLREAGVAFADAAGNAYLEFAGNIVYVVGNTPAQQPRDEKVVRAFQPAGLRVIFALLCAPEWIQLPTRELARRLDVANGTVGRVLDDLTHLGFVTTAGQRNRQMHKLPELLERWVMLYPVQLRPTLMRRRLMADQADWWRNVKFNANHVALGGEPAADVLTQYLKPGIVTLFVRGEPKTLNEIIARNHLRTDPTGNVEVLDAFWPADLPTEQPGLVPTPLIYADLLAKGDARHIETAKLIYDEHLAGRFKQT